MKITVNAKDLSKALRIAAKVILPKNIIQIYDSFHLRTNGGRLEVTGANERNTVRVNIPVVSIEEEGACCVSAKSLTELVSLLPNEEIRIASDATKMSMKWKKGSKTAGVEDVESYPMVEEPGDENLIVLKAGALRDALDMVSPLLKDNELRPMLEAMCLEQRGDMLRVIGTDSRVLRYTSIKGVFASSGQVLLHKSAAALVKSAIETLEEDEVKISYNEKSVKVEAGGTVVISRGCGSKFVNYEGIITPKSAYQSGVKINRKDVVDSLKRIKSTAVAVEMSGEEVSGLCLKGENLENNAMIEEFCECRTDGDVVKKMKFSVELLLSLLTSLSCEEIHMGVADKRAVVLTDPSDVEELTKSMIVQQV